MGAGRVPRLAHVYDTWHGAMEVSTSVVAVDLQADQQSLMQTAIGEDSLPLLQSRVPARIIAEINCPSIITIHRIGSLPPSRPPLPIKLRADRTSTGPSKSRRTNPNFSNARSILRSPLKTAHDGGDQGIHPRGGRPAQHQERPVHGRSRQGVQLR
nr:hypothetical protein CFP56_53643 [Quercus suber]